jgi:lipopolysaccharide biosynthesis regulator YciM
MGYPKSQGEGYIRPVPAPPRSEYEVAKARENLIEALRALVMYYMNCEDWSHAYDFAEALTKVDRSHFNQFVWLAQLQEIQGDESGALLNWKEAYNICERDKASPRDWIEALKATIRREIERLASLEVSSEK